VRDHATGGRAHRTVDFVKLAAAAEPASASAPSEAR